MTQDISRETVEHFIARFESGQQGCHMDCDDAQEFTKHLRALLDEREEWKAAATRHHPNPADFRYWEGRYRDENARVKELEMSEAEHARAQKREHTARYALATALGHAPEAGICDAWGPPQDVQLMEEAATLLSAPSHDAVAIAAIQGLCVGYWSHGGLDAADIVTTANQIAAAFIAARNITPRPQ